MTRIKLDIVTPESTIYSGEVDAVVAPGVEGELGILPHHTPLITLLKPGELRVRRDDNETCIAVYGGFLEIRPDRVIILAEAAERAEQINANRAEAAKRLAEQHLADSRTSQVARAQAEAALRQALVSLRIAEKEKRKGKRPRS